METQRENAAREFDPSIGFALDWLKENAHELESTVHKPPMVSVNVSNRAYAWQVEMCTSVSVRRVISQYSKVKHHKSDDGADFHMPIAKGLRKIAWPQWPKH